MPGARQEVDQPGVQLPELSALVSMLAAKPEGQMEHADVDRMRERHPAWRLLRAGNGPLVLTFLGRFFVEDNNGATAAAVLASALDDELYTLNAADPASPGYPKAAGDYLEDWAHPDAGWLRRFYPLGSDEVYYDATPAFEKAYAWVTSLGVRPSCRSSVKKASAKASMPGLSRANSQKCASRRD
jgi:Protein of unknown function (DUF3375)